MTTVQVLFAGYKDSAETFARVIAAEITSRHQSAALHCLSELGASLSMALPCVVILVLGNARDGGIVENAKRFIDWVEGLSDGELVGMREAVVRVGTGQGVQIDRLLKQKGALEIAETGDIANTATLEVWLSGLWKSLNIAIRDIAEFSGLARSLSLPPVPPSYLYSRLLSKRLLTEANSETRIFELTLDSCSQKPAPGSLIAIYPDNDLAAVSEIIARFNFDANLVLDSELQLHPSVRWRAELPLNVFDYVQRYVDFSSPVTVLFARYFAAHIKQADSRADFERIIAQSADSTTTLPMPYSLLYLLRTYPAIDYFYLEETLPQLPPLLPRSYAVSSSPLELSDSVQIAVEVHGVCSKYLEKLSNLELAKIPILLRAAFSPSSLWSELSEASNPLLITAGVGIAAFRGVLEQLSQERRRPVRVIYACSQPVKGSEAHDCDFPYQDDIRGLVSILGGKLKVITVTKGLAVEAALLAAVREAAEEVRQWAKAVALCGCFPTASLHAYLRELLPERPILVSEWT